MKVLFFVGKAGTLRPQEAQNKFCAGASGTAQFPLTEYGVLLYSGGNLPSTVVVTHRLSADLLPGFASSAVLPVSVLTSLLLCLRRCDKRKQVSDCIAFAEIHWGLYTF